jgi:hypothetical protein
MSDSTFDKNSYAAFDGTSIRDLIINRLNQGKVFTDQNYQGSNLSALIDVIGYTFSTLLYYLNKTSSESMFSEAQLYENMNRIVKILNYNPVGRLGSSVPYTVKATATLPKNNYIIPRYSYANVGGSIFSIPTDVTFTKYTDNDETITDGANTNLVYQGIFQEYPLYTALGIDNEITFITLDPSIYIDHFNIFVYVKPKETGKWEQWERATDLFLYGTNDSVYEVRFNENKNYEIKFGDSVNGRKLKTGDLVQIYYLQVDQNSIGIGANGLDGNSLIPFQSTTYKQILNDIAVNNNYLSLSQLTNVTLTNDYPSTSYKQEESIDSIRNNAPKAFRSQHRLVTTSDYINYIISNYSNFISDAKVISNDDYLSGHLKYLYDIGLNQPQIENRILLNQINYANSCNFNNLYLYLVPNSPLQEYLNSPQKELILNGLKGIKTITSQLVPIDPTYMYLDFYVPNSNTTQGPNDLDTSSLVITKNPNTRRANSAILSDIQNLFNNTFNRNVNKLGQLVDIYQLSTSILNIDGVTRVQTYRSDIDTYIEGLSLLFWDNLYPENYSYSYTQNIQLQYFQYPIFNNVNNITSKIKIQEVVGSIKAADF